MKSKMEIWDSLSLTPPEYTTAVPGAAGLTGVKPQYTAMALTRQFGPAGIGWGIEVVKEEVTIVPGAAPETAQHSLLLKLWYITADDKGNPVRGEVYDYGCTPVFTFAKGSYTPTKDLQKCSFSDGINRVARLIGCNAAIFLGENDPQAAADYFAAAPVAAELEDLLAGQGESKDFDDVLVSVKALSPGAKQHVAGLVAKVRKARGWPKEPKA